MILIFKNNSKLHFRGIYATITKILSIITSAKGKGTQCTHHGKAKGSFYPREISLCHVKGTRQGGSAQRERNSFLHYNYGIIGTYYGILCQVKRLATTRKARLWNIDQATGQHKLLQVGGLGRRVSVEQCQKMAILLTV